MVESWFAPLDLEQFAARHFRRTPLARTGTAPDVVPLLDWKIMGRILGTDAALDVVTVAAGRLVDVPVPRSLEDLTSLLARGVSVVIRDGERHDPQLRGIAEAFGAVVAGEVHVQLYATPGGTNSYGWHYDFEDVFIAQTAGSKDYYFRANTIARDTHLGESLDFSVIRHETSPIYSTRLLPADCLYIPSRWWHLVRCAEDALSISVGVMPLREAGRARAESGR